VSAIPVTHSSATVDGTESGSPSGGPSTGARPLFLFGLEFSLDTAPLDALEVVARGTTGAQVAHWFSGCADTEEAAVLTTCHRVELTLLTRSREEVNRWRTVLPGPWESWTLREGRDAIHHVFRVAAGRESLAVGESEVGHQVRAAGRSIESRHPRPVLRDLFAAAADAAEEVCPAVASSPSIAAAAAVRLMELVGRPSPRVLVVGSGTVGRQVVEHLSNAARLTVVFHQRTPEESFLRATGARAVPLGDLSTELAGADAVVTAAKFGNHGLAASDLPRDHPLVLVDLGMPRNIDPDVRGLPNVRLVDLEELHDRSGRRPLADESDLRVDLLARQFSERVELLLLEPWVDAFRRASEEVRRSELENARPFLGNLDPEQQAAVERLTRRLVTRLLAAPTERIRSLPTGPEGDVQRRFALDLFRPRADDP
jgi:glutamyl-tRNA reductase